MYSICTYIWAIYGVNGGKYSIHGAYGYGIINRLDILDYTTKYTGNCDNPKTGNPYEPTSIMLESQRDFDHSCGKPSAKRWLMVNNGW